MYKISVEQMLFGYRDGHTLMATSMKKSLMAQKDVEVLSDSSGAGIFKDYITCFPLVEDGYFAFAKTWYADEIHRPGCVWTHMLFVKFADLEKYQGCFPLDDLFVRPQLGENLSEYSKTIECSTFQKKEHSKYASYLIYTLFSSDKRIIVDSPNYQLFEKPLLQILLKMPVNILRHFSVCTYSINNRYLKGEAFSYQITEEGNSKYLSRELDDAIVCRSINDIEKYPLWVQFIEKLFINEEQNKLIDLYNVYKCQNKSSFREIAKLIYTFDGLNQKISLTDYYNVLHKLENSDYFIEKTIDNVYCKEINIFDEIFIEDGVIMFLLDDIINNKGILKTKKINKSKNINYAQKLYDTKSKEVMPLLQKYIHGQLDANGAKLVKQYICLLQPDDLDMILGMDLNICSVLVKMNYKFLLCKKIWKQSKNFQLELLNLAQIPQNAHRKIISCIIRNSDKEINLEVYEIFGDEIISVIYECCCGKNAISEKKSESWIQYLAKEKIYYKKWLGNTHSVENILTLMKNIDSYSVYEIEELDMWLDIFCKYQEKFLRVASYFVSFFMFPIILQRKDELPIQLVDKVYNVIYKKLEKAEMEYYDWKKLDPLLPDVDIEKSWDKCLRMRMAFNKD